MISRRRWRAAFTLIEVLVVVAIIALLVVVLLPALSRAKEQSRRVVCLSQLRQQGFGFSAYANSNRNMFPCASKFRFALMEQTNYIGHVLDPENCSSNQAIWAAVNCGGLFPKYVGKTGDLYYCPSNTQMTKDNPDNGLKALWQRYNHPRRIRPDGTVDPEYVRANDFPMAPKGSYGYAIPAGLARFPRDLGPKMLNPEITMTDNPGCNPAAVPTPSEYSKYVNDAGELDSSFLGPWPRSRRGLLPNPVLVADAYFGEWSQGYHMGGYNALFYDLHARWILDPGGRIRAANLPDPTFGYSGITSGKAKGLQVWEYFSRNP